MTLDPGNDAVSVCQGNLAGTFQAVEGKVANFDLQAKRDGVVGAQFDPAAGLISMAGTMR